MNDCKRLIHLMTSVKPPQLAIRSGFIWLQAAELHVWCLLITFIQVKKKTLLHFFLFFDLALKCSFTHFLLVTILVWFNTRKKQFSLFVRNLFLSSPNSIISDLIFAVFCRMGPYEEPKKTCGTICLKYLLFIFNFMFWVSLHSSPSLSWGFECFSSSSRAATCLLQTFSNHLRLDIWVRWDLRQETKKPGSNEVLVSKHEWRMKKMRRKLFSLQTVKNRDNWLIPAAILACGISAKLHIFTEDTAMPPSKSSELSSNEDTAFQDWPNYK